MLLRDNTDPSPAGSAKAIKDILTSHQFALMELNNSITRGLLELAEAKVNGGKPMRHPIPTVVTPTFVDARIKDGAVFKVKDGESTKVVRDGDDFVSMKRISAKRLVDTLIPELKQSGDTQILFREAVDSMDMEALALALSVKHNGKYDYDKSNVDHYLPLHEKYQSALSDAVLKGDAIQMALMLAAGSNPNYRRSDDDPKYAADFEKQYGPMPKHLNISPAEIAAHRGPAIGALAGISSADPLAKDEFGMNAIDYVTDAIKMTQMFAKDFSKPNDRSLIDNTRLLSGLKDLKKRLEERAAVLHPERADPKTAKEAIPDEMQKALDAFAASAPGAGGSPGSLMQKPANPQRGSQTADRK
jgi:hypothetical protein